MTRASASCTPLTLAVLLQSMKQEPPLDAKCRDKFLVQSVIITADKEFTNVAQIVGSPQHRAHNHVLTGLQWDSVEKSAIQEKKIRVLWLPPSQDASLQPVATPVRRPVSNGVCLFLSLFVLANS